MSIVAIPGMPGERIDSRILGDVQAIMAKYKVKVTDGYAPTGHAAGGEHPLGLAVDLIPDPARGGSWDDVDRLAEDARKSGVFRWIGYDGAPGHGRGHHLHLSWLGRDGGEIRRFAGGGDDDDGLFGRLILPLGGLAAPLGRGAGVATVEDPVTGALLNALWDLVGKEGAKAMLYLALVLGGTTLAMVGLARTVGISVDDVGSVAKLAATKGRKA